MRRSVRWPLLLALLAGCATPPPPPAAVPARFTARGLEVWIDGTMYAGPWTEGRCFTDACRGPWRDVARIHRRQVRWGRAELATADGQPLVCAWAAYAPRLEGTCRTPDGRVHRLALHAGGVATRLP